MERAQLGPPMVHMAKFDQIRLKDLGARRVDDRQTDRHTDTQTNAVNNKGNPSDRAKILGIFKGFFILFCRFHFLFFRLGLQLSVIKRIHSKSAKLQKDVSLFFIISSLNCCSYWHFSFCCFIISHSRFGRNFRVRAHMHACVCAFVCPSATISRTCMDRFYSYLAQRQDMMVYISTPFLFQIRSKL